MEKASTSGGARPREPISAPAADQDLPALVARLGDGILGLLDSKITLLKLDVQETIRAYERETVALALAAITVAIGVTLVGCGLAFVLVYALPSTLDPLLARALAFGVIGTLAVISGVVTLLRRSGGVDRRDG
ncbi:MAG: hypothetical protein ABIR79_15355 [Candidatus Binatia bacterium]